MRREVDGVRPWRSPGLAFSDVEASVCQGVGTLLAAPEAGAADESAIVVQVQRQVHGIERAVAQL